MHNLHILFLTCVLSFASFQSASAESPYQEQFNRIYLRVEKKTLVENAHLKALKSKLDGKINTGEQLRKAIAQLAALANGEVLSHKQSKAWLCRQGSGYIGLGISYEPFQLVGSSGILITKVVPESTAQDAGLGEGDRILLVDGKNLDGLSLQEAVDNIPGPDGTFVELTVDDGTSIKTVSVKRDLDERIGVEIQLDKPRNLVNLSYVYHDSPAENAGLKEGDLIYKVGGTPVEAIDFEKLSSALNTEEIGDKTQLTVLRDGKELEIEVTADLVSFWSDSFSVQGQWGGSGDPRYSYWLMGLKNLDFDGLADLSSHYQQDYDRNGCAAIIDLRGCSGDDPELAAKVLAGFIGGTNGDLLFVRERVDGKEVTTRYAIRNGSLVRFRDGHDLEVIEFELPEKYFSGKLAVIVDGETSGTAEAVAYALQRWRDARIVGSSTAGRAVVKTHAGLEDGKYVTFESGTLLDARGKKLSGVKIDRRLWYGSDPVDSAKNELAGVYWYNSVETFLYGGMILFAVFVVILSFIRARKNCLMMEQENVLVESENEEQVVESDMVALDIRAEDAGESEPPSSEPNTPFQKWQICVLLAVVIGFFAMMFLLPSLTNGPPSGAYSKVTVEFFTDGSEGLKNQQAVINQLASEYSGSIEFKTIDVVKNPHLNQGDDAVENVPSVRVRKRWFDNSGKVISSSSLTWGGKVPKRDLVPAIERAAESNQDYWPDTEIKRKKASKP